LPKLEFMALKDATVKSRYGEIAALAAISIMVAFGGKLVLANLSTHRAAAAAAIAILIAVASVALRRVYRFPNDETRIVITKYVAYLVAAILALWDVLAPAKWIPGSCIVAAEVALVFDIITIWARRNVAGGT
jgi:ABC-type Fe3+-siderophore transport system permease subunit